MRTQKIMKWSFLAVMLLGNISISCTKYDTPDFVEETGGVSGNLSVKKNVLWINLDRSKPPTNMFHPLCRDALVYSLLASRHRLLRFQQ